MFLSNFYKKYYHKLYNDVFDQIKKQIYIRNYNNFERLHLVSIISYLNPFFLPFLVF